MSEDYPRKALEYVWRFRPLIRELRPWVFVTGEGRRALTLPPGSTVRSPKHVRLNARLMPAHLPILTNLRTETPGQFYPLLAALAAARQRVEPGKIAGSYDAAAALKIPLTEGLAIHDAAEEADRHNRQLRSVILEACRLH